ncbi:MAG: DUF72 domain-containing protein [Candidatus Aminicenantes bacterium]|nr:DUF72 domain-containing protein [Candidatus Aminicenantes bacterium]
MIYHLGTSGWSYNDWRGRFYPEEISQKEWLPFYSQHFSTVEINMTFYRYPKPETLKGWLDKVPEDFKFTLKANRQITHRKRIKGVKNEVRYFYVLADSLGHKLGCILFQLPPFLTMDLVLLEEFLSTLSPKYKNVIEFRHESWYEDEVYKLLKSYNVIFCTVSSAKVPKDVVETAESAYFRFHGLTGGYKYSYSEKELKKWAETIRKTKVMESFVYFNNDYHAYAVENCRALREFL